MAIGALLGAALAVLVIKYRVDQIIAGVVINIFALGLTSFLATRVLGPEPAAQRAGPVRDDRRSRSSRTSR